MFFLRVLYLFSVFFCFLCFIYPLNFIVYLGVVLPKKFQLEFLRVLCLLSSYEGFSLTRRTKKSDVNNHVAELVWKITKNFVGNIAFTLKKTLM